MAEPKDEAIKKVIELGTGAITPQEKALQGAAPEIAAVMTAAEAAKKSCNSSWAAAREK